MAVKSVGTVRLYPNILTSMKRFARKLIRLSTRVPEADIKNEARVVSSIRAKGGHEHIINILDHGWLKGALHVYFIDMELGTLTLADYIDYFSCDKPLPTNRDASSLFVTPVFVNRECSPSARLQNMWTIATHISRGVEFMHFNEHVHRDLKPSNGISTLYYERKN
jgi:serine/threonine protein kinase